MPRSKFQVALPLLASALAIALSTPASAATYVFSLSGPNTASFTIDSSPVPTTTGFGSFTLSDVSGAYNGSLTTFSSISFFSGGQTSGGLRLNSTVDLQGPQLFTGLLSSPTFSLGTFFLDDGFRGRYSLSVTNGAVPEPSTWVMMLLGFGAVGASMRRRRQTTLRKRPLLPYRLR
jgi:hypothetical protein